MIEQSAIRTRGNLINIGERLHGRVIDNDFVRCDSLRDHAPALSSIPRSSDSDILAVSGDSAVEAPSVPPVSAPQHPQ